jgi:uncharacterized RDD family membrane protein YckC
VSAEGPGYDAGHIPARRHRVVTPEGVPLDLVVASAWDRLGALLLDQLIVVAGVLVLAVPLFWLLARKAIDGDLALAALALGVFLARNAYYPGFELAWQGRTPGKRLLRIRAVDRRGGPLTPEAVLARNLTREVEIFLPLLALGGAGSFYPGAPGLARLVALLWLLLFGLLPLFNPDRLRVGDLLAGTMVVLQPEPALLEDLSAAAPAPGPEPFSEAQLDAYGIYELQVLEGVLRGTGPGHDQALVAVAAKIRTRIGWAGGEPPEEFLRRYYAALRARLEGKLLLGKRRADKHHAGR